MHVDIRWKTKSGWKRYTKFGVLVNLDMNTNQIEILDRDGTLIKKFDYFAIDYVVIEKGWEHKNKGVMFNKCSDKPCLQKKN
jgi:hypothetical protein